MSETESENEKQTINKNTQVGRITCRNKKGEKEGVEYGLK